MLSVLGLTITLVTLKLFLENNKIIKKVLIHNIFKMFGVSKIFF